MAIGMALKSTEAQRRLLLQRATGCKAKMAMSMALKSTHLLTHTGKLATAGLQCEGVAISMALKWDTLPTTAKANAHK